VSIKIVKQQNTLDRGAELIIITHSVKESRIQKAIKEIKKLDVVNEVCALIRMGLHS
jgi:ACT domain-containing protein